LAVEIAPTISVMISARDKILFGFIQNCFIVIVLM